MINDKTINTGLANKETEQTSNSVEIIKCDEPDGALTDRMRELIQEEIIECEERRVELRTHSNFREVLEKEALDIRILLNSIKMHSGNVAEIGALTKLLVDLEREREDLIKESESKVSVVFELKVDDLEPNTGAENERNKN